MILTMIVSVVLGISLVFSLYIIKRQQSKYKILLKEGEIRYKNLLAEYEHKLKTNIKNEKQRQLKEAASMTHHLSNVISGMNHELSPWIGGIKNKVSKITSKSKSSTISLHLMGKFNEILRACDSMALLLDNLSRDVKRVQKYDNVKSCVLDTILSWIHLTITDRSIKEDLSEENFVIDGPSLLFDCNHSPMLLSQVILNLVKNSIEHNPTKLDTLKIKVYGDAKLKALIYEDNGKGILDDRLEEIFTPGLTTKDNDKEMHGLGLSLCKDYCSSMGAIILAESNKSGAKFVIYFDTDKSDTGGSSRLKKIKKQRESAEYTAIKLGSGNDTN